MEMNIEIYGNLIRLLEYSTKYDKMIIRIFSRKIGKSSPNAKGDGYMYSILETNLYSDHETEQIIFYKDYNCKSSAWAYITKRKKLLEDIGYELTDSKNTSYYKNLFAYANK